LKGVNAASGTLSLVYKGDAAHSSFDNCAFWSNDKIVFVEDAGDTLHTQRNALDSAYLFDVNTDYSNKQPVRIMAQGRDPSATIDSGFTSMPGVVGFQNEGDNEITGFHVSSGEPTVHGLLAAEPPNPQDPKWRAFYTSQHEDNITWEIISAKDLPKGKED
jgi:hypothetical protein